MSPAIRNRVGGVNKRSTARRARVQRCLAAAALSTAAASSAGLGTDGNDITVTFTALPEATAVWILRLPGIARRRRRRPLRS
jgi:hypothetical protein